jgi:ABC-type glutathione transport system ATPase component
MPMTLFQKIEKLKWQYESNERTIKKLNDEIVDVESFLAVADRTTSALELLSQSLFEEVLGVLESKLTIAIQEVLGQPIKFKSKPDFKRGAAAVSFSIDREGNEEDVLRGQGGSVQNVLSVGLRMFALATLDEQRHRRFLVLDEQDCWLRPELVPRLVNIVHRAAKELEFQVLMISHHDVNLFDRYADRVYRLTPNKSAVDATIETSQPPSPDVSE